MLREGYGWERDAHEIGLVQELGGLYDAIDRAAELAELGDDFEVIEIPEVSNPMDEFTEMLDAEAKVPYIFSNDNPCKPWLVQVG